MRLYELDIKSHDWNLKVVIAGNHELDDEKDTGSVKVVFTFTATPVNQPPNMFTQEWKYPRPILTPGN